MKKLLSLLLIVLTLACTLTIVSCDYEVPDDLQSTDPNSFIFKNVLGGLCVEGLKNTCTDTEIIIPSYVKQGNKNKKVVEIADSAFSGKDHVTKIAIPGTVKKIGDLAFQNCTNLREVYIEKGVETFGAKLFWGSSVEKIYFSGTAKEFQNIKEKFEGIKELLGLDDFYDVWYNTGLYDGSRPFYVYCSDAMITYKYPNGVESVTIYDKASKGLDYTLNADGNSYSVSGIGTCTDTDIIIPSQFNGKPVTAIGVGAFANRLSFTSVVIPNSITSIAEGSFFYCSNLQSVVIPDSVTSIGNGAFSSCSSLTSVVIPDSVTSIGDGAFFLCSSLTSVVIGDSVASISENAFFLCSSLTSVVIGDSVTSIGSNAFSYCSSLTSVVIPDSVTSIGNGAFSRCQSLTSLIIPDSVTSISENAFFWCSSLTSVVIGDSVTSIGEKAFYWCDSLTKVYYNGTAAEWNRISIDSDNDNLNNATRYYYSETKPTTSGNFWHWVGGKPVAW